jgi:lipase (class 2)
VRLTRTPMTRAAGVLLMTAAMTVSGSVALAQASEEPGEQGPPLSVPADALRDSLRCGTDIADGHDTPVLLIPGTTLTSKEDFSWNYERAFTATSRPYCAVRLPDHAMGDIQHSAEYVAYAIRTMARRAGRKIGVVGHSQGGMIGRWALKYWPDTRADMDDLIGLAPSNHGTADATALCAAPVGCQPSVWQQRPDSRFLTALNTDRETYPGIDYTVVYTNTDEVVTPNLSPSSLTNGLIPRSVGSLSPAGSLLPPASSPLRGGGDNVRNIAVQGICPGHLADHLTIGTSDPVAYALVVDALDHPGPANPHRIDRSVCARLFQPGVNPTTFATDFAQLGATAATQIALSPRTPAEPPLQPYARRYGRDPHA